MRHLMLELVVELDGERHQQLRYHGRQRQACTAASRVSHSGDLPIPETTHNRSRCPMTNRRSRYPMTDRL